MSMGKWSQLPFYCTPTDLTACLSESLEEKNIGGVACPFWEIPSCGCLRFAMKIHSVLDF